MNGCARGEQVYNTLSERAGIKDHAAVLGHMISKVATNVKVYGACDDIIQATLALFQVRSSHACACIGANSANQ